VAPQSASAHRRQALLDRRIATAEVNRDGAIRRSLRGEVVSANDLNAYTVNNVTAKRNADGSVTVQFGGCDGDLANCLPICAGWNYMVRLYRPRKEVLDGTWKSPEATAAS
jgi:hypothetical protein